jgi:hypothetical protein
MLWAGIWRDQMIGIYLFDGNITWEMYPQTFLVDFLHGVTLQVRSIMSSQQDGALRHFALIACEFLNRNFNNKWIEWRGPVGWPSRAPDLIALEFPFGAIRSLLPTRSSQGCCRTEGNYYIGVNQNYKRIASNGSSNMHRWIYMSMIVILKIHFGILMYWVLYFTCAYGDRLMA